MTICDFYKIIDDLVGVKILGCLDGRQVELYRGQATAIPVDLLDSIIDKVDMDICDCCGRNVFIIYV